MMKKSMAFIFFVLLISWFVFGVDADKSTRFTVQVNCGFFFSSDDNFKDVYGSTLFYPGIRAGYGITDCIYLWLGYGYLSKNGTTPLLEEEAKSTQHRIALGAGYRGDFSEKLGYRLQAGILYFSYKEEALGEEVSDSAIGFGLEGSLVLDLGGNFFGLVFLGYDYGTDDVGGVNIKLGGFKTGIGLGVRF